MQLDGMSMRSLLAVATLLGLHIGLSSQISVAANNSVGTASAYQPRDETNTGVLKGISLKHSEGFTVTTPGATIEGLDVIGVVAIAAPGVTLRNLRISASSWVVLDIRGDGAVIENCEINGLSAPGIRGISVTAKNISIRKCNIHNSEDGVYLGASSDVTIEENYIHDLSSNWDGPHYDGVAMDGSVSNIRIRNNNIVNPHDQTSAVMISNYFGPSTDVFVENNRLSGGGYTVYSDAQFGKGPLSGIQITGNRLVKGAFGFASINDNEPLWRNNVDDQNDSAIGR